VTAKNEADRRSELLRARKRRAINVHLGRRHRREVSWEEDLEGKTTIERMNLHYDLHEEGAGHVHEDIDDWEEIERENDDGK